MPGNPGQRTATSQWFLERKSTFVHQQVVLNPSASCEITQSNMFPIYNEREGTVKCVTPLFLTPLLLCIFPFVCCRYQLLPGRASRCAAVRPACVLCDRASTSQHIVAAVAAAEVSMSAKPRSGWRGLPAQCFHCHCTFVWLNTDAQLGNMAEPFTHILESH